MDAFLFLVAVVGMTGLALWLGVGAVYWVLVALINAIYRATRGHGFRWFSRWTLGPLLLLGIPCFIFAWVAWSSYPGPK